MKQINNVLTTVTNQQSIQKASESPQRFDNADQVRDFINDLFRALKACYPAWRQAFSTEQEYRDARLMWTRAMAEAGIRSMDQVRKGVEAARSDTSDFMPGPGKFIQWCRPSAGDMGMPEIPQAWHEASSHSHHVIEHTWSHPGVYEAGRRCGWFGIRNGDLGRREYEREYLTVVAECADGAVFNTPAPDSTLLECHRNGEEIRTKENKAAAADALAKLRQSFK